VAPCDDPGGFTPRSAIAPHTARPTISERPAVVRARLRELPMIYILMLGIAIVSRLTIFGSADLTLYQFDVALILALVGMIALLWSRWPIPLAWLKALELGMLGLLACRVTLVQYRLMLVFSLHDDPMMAQLTMKNIVLLTSILILTYGLYVPKSWRRAALVVGPLSVLPFATLLVLYLQYPEAMAWLEQGWKRNRTTPRVLLLGFDAMILLTLAVGSTFGARMMSRLRREAAEARQLGQYRLLRQIGAGGMGEVYLAEHQLLKRPCALKLIRPGCADDPRTQERFEREVRLTATLSHPNTVEIYDYGRAEDGTYYYVMEYLRGLGLADLVERHGPLAPARAVYLLRQVCGALREAHAAGLIHRDIKPSNIFAARRGGVEDIAKLLDFGLVRPVTTDQAPAAHLSAEGQILGTPLFMPPEQAGGGELGERSDIYALGAVAYYLLTGRPPFEGPSGLAVMIAHARDPVVPPSRLRPDIPEDLERVVLRCLAKDPAGRFPDAASLERALGACGCAGDWDADRAARWWRDADRSPADRDGRPS
jgi:serine/threonine-protein kinase